MGASWGRLGGVWRHLGAFLEASWGLFEASLGASWGRLEVLLILRRAESSKILFSNEITLIFLVPGMHFRNENQWKIDLDLSEGDPGCSWAALGRLLGAFRWFWSAVRNFWTLSGRIWSILGSRQGPYT